jgi:hypothetical protein
MKPKDPIEFTHPTNDPRPYRVVEVDDVPVSHLTIVIRNQRIRRLGGSDKEPVLRREFITGDDWESIIDSMCHALHDLGDVQLRFIGEGVDPGGILPDDADSAESSQSAAIIATFEGERVAELRFAAASALAKHRLDNCWFLLTPGDVDSTVLYPAHDENALASGSLATAASDRDIIDARCFLRLLRAHREWERERKDSGNLKALREWLWFNWQVPRRAGPLLRSKYSKSWPWSAAARAAYEADPKRCRVVVEHREPVNLVIRELIDRTPSEPAELVHLLNDRLACCVVTKDENDQITSAGFQNKMPLNSSDDPWARYRASSIDPEQFSPLN